MGKIKRPEDLSSERLKNARLPNPNWDQHSPIFCFKHLQKDYDIPDLQQADQAALVNQLRTLSKLTWQDIKQSGRHGLGTEKIARSSIKVAIPTVITEDVQFLAFRFSGKKPMIGYRSHDVFHLVFLDHDFSVYNH